MDKVEKKETAKPTTSTSSCQTSVLEALEVLEVCVCVYSMYLISPFFKITKANVGINLASVYLNSARGMSVVSRPANHIHWSRFTVGTDKKKRNNNTRLRDK